MQPAMDQVKLPAVSGLLILTAEGPWCRVSLREGDHPEVDLGAESRPVVVTRLADAVANPEKLTVTGELAGVPVSWVLSLAEMHASFHVHAMPNQTRIFIQDASGAVAHTLDLGPDEIAAWRRLLV